MSGRVFVLLAGPQPATRGVCGMEDPSSVKCFITLTHNTRHRPTDDESTATRLLIHAILSSEVLGKIYI